MSEILPQTPSAKYTSKAAQAYKLAIDKHITNPGQQIRDFCNDVTSEGTTEGTKSTQVAHGFYGTEYVLKIATLQSKALLKNKRREVYKKLPTTFSLISMRNLKRKSSLLLNQHPQRAAIANSGILFVDTRSHSTGSPVNLES